MPEEWVIIHAYSRAQAIADGTLVDVTELAREAGYKIPVALTHAVYEDCVAWTPADSERRGIHQDQTGRLWDVLFMAKVFLMLRPAYGPSRIPFRVARIQRHGRLHIPEEVRLIVHFGGGDNAEPVFTIMQPHED